MQQRFGLMAWAPGFLLGAALQLQQPSLWAGSGYRVLVVLALLLLVLAWWSGRRRGSGAGWRVGVSALVAGLALGFGQTGWRAQERLAQELPAELESRDLEVVGSVEGLPVRRLEGMRFRFEVASARRIDNGQVVPLPRKLSLGWYRGWDDGALLAEPARQLQPGQRWRLVVRLKRPHGLLNPHGFDYELWLFEQDVRATGTVRYSGPATAELLADDVSGPVVLIDRWRLHLRAALQRQLGDTPAAGVLAALVVGDQTAIGRDDWEVFRSTGVAHLVAISGLHVTMFAWVAGAAVAAGWRRSRRLMLWRPAVSAGRWGGLLAAAAYALLAGWGVPAQRTVFMLGVATLVRAAGWRWPWPAVLGLAALVVTAIDPWALLQPGFWLSFFAVALLLVRGREPDDGAGAPAVLPGAPASPGADGGTDRHAAAGRLQPWTARAWRLGWHAARDGSRTQLLITLGLAPLTLLFFHQLSLVGLLANLVAIPCITLLVTPLALLGVLVSPLWWPALWLMQGLMVLLAELASWPLATWHAPAAPWWLVLAGLAGAVLLVVPVPRVLRLLGLPLLLPLLDAPLALPPPGQFELLAADIGQGNAVLIRTHGHTLLYDAGPRYSAESDAGERVLVPLLHALGVRQLDVLVLSHADQDHIGGAASVLRGIGARQVTGSLAADHGLRQLAPFQPCQAGQGWSWDGVRFELLHPQPRDYERAGRGALRPNGLSCVLHIAAAGGPAGTGRSVLLTGDIEREQELQLLTQQETRIRSDVLLMPHHGSRTSSTAEWLAAVGPGLALAQAGYLNRYGHPAVEVLERYRMHSIGVVRTDQCGAWHWRSADATHWCERGRERRYWHALPQGNGPELAKNFSFIDYQP